MAPNALHKLANTTNEELDSKALQLRQRFFEEYNPKSSAECFEMEDVCRLREDDGYCRRFVAHQRNNVDKALNMVREVFKWRKEFGVKDIQESTFPSALFEAEGMYPFKTDKDGNPVLMFKVGVHVKDSDGSDLTKKFLVFWLEELERRHSNPLIVCLFDFYGSGVTNMDVEQTMFFIACFLRHYPYLVGYMLALNMPWIFNALWKMAKTVLPRSSKDKIIFVDKESILNYIPAENLPVSMGGECTYDGRKEIEDYKETLQQQLKLVNYTNLPEVDKNIDLKKTLKNQFNLELSPMGKLTFPYGGENEKSSTILKLRNISNQSLGYKIRGNNIEAYKVKPFTGFLEPDSVQLISIDLVDGQPCQPKDKFLVQAVPVKNKHINVHKFNALWRAAPKLQKEEHMLECCKAAKVFPPKEMTHSLEATSKSQVTKDRLTTLKVRFVATINLTTTLSEMDFRLQLAELSHSVRSVQRQNTVLRLCLLTLTLALVPVVWLLYEVVDLLRVQPGGLCDRTIRDSLLATVLCKTDRTILPSHMM